MQLSHLDVPKLNTTGLHIFISVFYSPEHHCSAGSWRWWKSQTNYVPQSGNKSSSRSTKTSPALPQCWPGNTYSAAYNLEQGQCEKEHEPKFCWVTDDLV